MIDGRKPLKIFLAGSTGAVGKVLCRLLVKQGYEVHGLTRKTERSGWLESIGVKPVIADVYDKERIKDLLKSIQPDIIIHQLTDLPFGLPSEKMKEALIANAKIRDTGTRNLIYASKQTMASRFILQSIAFRYRPGPVPHRESDPLDSEDLRKFENQVLDEEFSGIVLRYGRFYGPDTGFDEIEGPCKIHVHAAAWAACLAVTEGKKGVYNIVEDIDFVSNEKAVRELGWIPGKIDL